jgi:chloramphenicol 3-O phosphotransferase
MNGNIIILDGSPSVGKTTIAEKLQEIMEEPYLYFPIDLFVRRLPTGWIQFARDLTRPAALTYKMETDSEGKPKITLEIGPVGEKLIQGYLNAIQGFSTAGNHVIGDAIITDAKWLESMERTFLHLPVYFIGLFAPLEELEKREKSRFELPGTTRGRFDPVYSLSKEYDLFIDTSKLSSEEAAEKIKRLVIR